MKTTLTLKKTLLLNLILIISLALYAVTPVVTNSTATQRTDGSKIVDIYFDVSCTSGDSVYVSLNLSNDGGTTFNIYPNSANLSGDTGRIHTGTGKHIIWNAGNETQSFDGNQFACKVQAWDTQPMPANFVFVQGGTFNNGTSDVTVSSYYIDKYELTQSEYQDVIGSNPASGYGVGANYPVYGVSWFDAIEYCNRRSIFEGLTPCYSYSTYGTNPANWPTGWNTNDGNNINVVCSWTANGYRLPTESEWEFAARGGISTNNFVYSGSEDINAVAWYYNNSGNSTHIVGTKAANELGLFDMSGNLFEWCWDNFGDYPSGAQNNPHGATSGNPVYRGGRFNVAAIYCTVSYRTETYATVNYGAITIRCVRVSVRQEN